MDLINKMFGGSDKGKSIENLKPAEAIQRIRQIEEMLVKKQLYVEGQVQTQVDLIKANGMKNKRASLQALKRKKRLEKELVQIDGTLTTMEYQREALENANTNAEVLKLMSMAAKTLKGAHNMDITKVEDLVDEIREQQEIASEIAGVISNPAAFGQDVDEDELLKELEEMELEADRADEESELSKELEAVQRLPDAPQHDLPSPKAAATTTRSKKKSDEDELAELAAWAN